MNQFESKSSIKIRKAIPADIGILAEFNAGIAIETEHIQLIPEVIEAGISALINDPLKGFYLIAEIDGRVAGALMITKEWSDWRNGEFWWIQSVYIRAEFRRMGVYKALYTFLQNLVKDREDVCGFRLYVEKENRIAQAAYRNLGMDETVYKLFETELPGRVWKK